MIDELEAALQDGDWSFVLRASTRVDYWSQELALLERSLQDLLRDVKVRCLCHIQMQCLQNSLIRKTTTRTCRKAINSMHREQNTKQEEHCIRLRNEGIVSFVDYSSMSSQPP